MARRLGIDDAEAEVLPDQKSSVVQRSKSPGPIVAMAGDGVNDAPADLRGSAYGFFNLVSGVALLFASIIAGLLWDRLGAPTSSDCGAAFYLVTLPMLYGVRDNRSARARQL